MNTNSLHCLSRRQMLQHCGCGFGYLALTSLFADLAQTTFAAESNPLSAKAPPLPARAERVIFIFMHGGPSAVDTFDHKPLLTRDHGKVMPVRAGDLIAPNSKLLASPWEFETRGQSALEISDLFSAVAQCAEDLCLIRGRHSNVQVHCQAVLKLHTCHETQLRPSVGAWVFYGLGTENQNLSGFITISPSVFNGGPQNYGSAFLPAVYQGTPIGSDNTPLSQAQIRHIKNAEMPLDQQRRQLDLIQEMNRQHLVQAKLDYQL